MTNSGDSVEETLLKGGSIVFVGFVVQTGLGFGTKYLVATNLGPAGYGAIRVGEILLTFSSMIALLGIHTGIGRYLPRYEDSVKRRSVFLSGLRIVTVSSVVLGGAIAMFAGQIAAVLGAPGIESVVRIFGLATPLVVCMKIAIGSAQGLKKAVPKAAIQYVTFPVVRFVGVAVAVLVGLGSVGVAATYLIGYGVAAVAGGYYLFRHTDLLDRDTSDIEPMYRELMVFSAPLVITSAADTIFSDIDGLLLAYFGTTEQVGVYDVAFVLANLLLVVLLSFRFITMPLLSELHSEERFDELRRLYQTLSKWLFLVSYPGLLLLGFFPGTVISLTFGSEYLGGTLPLTILALGTFSHVVTGPAGALLVSVGDTRLQMLDYVVMAALNVVLNLVLIPPYGIIGAALATSLSYLALNVLYVFQLERRLKMRPVSLEFLQTAGSIGLVTAVSWLLGTMVPVDAHGRILVVGAGFLPGYVLICYVFAFGKRERRIVVNLLNRL